MNQLKFLPHRFLNKLYQTNFSIYRPLYFLYKYLSDYPKIRYIRSCIKPGMTAVDIGANIGFYTLELSHLVGATGQIHAFEPDPLNYKYLSNVTNCTFNVKINKLAVSRNSKYLKLYKSDQLNIDHRTYKTDKNRHSISIKAVSLDKYFRSQPVDFIKIDVQGYDYQALLGAKKILKRNHPLTILGEFFPFGLIKAGSSSKEYIEFLHGLGFKIKFLSTKSKKFLYQKHPNPNFYCDFIATKP